MYLCASFNHWFPMKMELKEDPQAAPPNGLQRQNSKHSSESMNSDEEVDDSPHILFNAGIASSNRKNDYLKLQSMKLQSPLPSRKNGEQASQGTMLDSQYDLNKHQTNVNDSYN